MNCMHDKKEFYEGYESARINDNDPGESDNPYPVNSEQWELWNFGWNNYGMNN